MVINLFQYRSTRKTLRIFDVREPLRVLFKTDAYNGAVEAALPYDSRAHIHPQSLALHHCTSVATRAGVLLTVYAHP